MGMDATSRIGEEDHGGFKALSLVKIHQPDNVGTARLKRERFYFACRFAVRQECIGRVGKAPSVCYYPADAIDGVYKVSGIDAPRCGCGQCEVARVFEDAVEGGGGWKDPRPSVVLTQCA